MSEVKLVIAAQRGNTKAFNQLLEMYENQLFRTAYGILGNRNDALDVVQDTFWQCFRSIASLNKPEAFKSWITKILVNKCMDSIRQNKRIVIWEDFSQFPQTQRENDQDLRMDISTAIGRLDEKYRLILSLRYFQDLSIQEIAQILNCPEGTVKSRLNYALLKLRKELGYSMEVAK